jgi:uncharacterized protein YecE (DUF72 family)
MRAPDERTLIDPALGRRGRVLAGTSGFSYASWSPTFYPPGTRPAAFLAHYAGRLPACELNNTFYARPKAERIRAWCDATPDAFRFIVKAQRGASVRGLAVDPAETVAWLTETLPGFGSRLGAVLYRIPAGIARRDEALAALLAAWPATIPLVVEAQHPSWIADETFAALRASGAVWCTTDVDDQDAPPDIRRTGPFLYLRLRRETYDDADLDDWARRVVPFLDDGLDAYVLFRHDEDGTNARQAEAFAGRVERIRGHG